MNSKQLYDALEEKYPYLTYFVMGNGKLVCNNFLTETNYIRETNDDMIVFAKVFEFIKKNEHMHSFWLL